MRFKINPNETAQENLWRAARFAVACHLGRSGITLRDDEKAEFFSRQMLATVLAFMRRLRKGKYCRKVSFFTNVWQAAWSVFYCQSERFLREVKDRINFTSLDAPIAGTEGGRIHDIIPESARAPLANYAPDPRYERRFQCPDDYKSDVAYNKAVDGEYKDYQMECVIMGVTPVTFKVFCERNDYYPQLIPAAQIKRNNYSRQYKEKKRRMLELMKKWDDPEYAGEPGRIRK